MPSTLYKKNAYWEFSSFRPVKILVTWLLFFACLVVWNTKAQGQKSYPDLKNKTPNELTKILAQFIRGKKTRFEHSDHSKKGNPLTVLYFGYTIEKVEGTRLIGLRTFSYKTAQDAKSGKNGKVNTEWLNPIDLKEIRSIYPSENAGTIVFNHPNTTIVQLNYYVKTRIANGVWVFDEVESVSRIPFLMPTDEDAKYVRKIIDAIKGHSHNVAKNNPTNPAVFSVRDVPSIMRNLAKENQGWNKAAELLEHWFDSPARKDPTNLRHPIVNWDMPAYPISMGWITDPKNSIDLRNLPSTRVTDAYKKLMDKKFYGDLHALSGIVRNLKKLPNFQEGAIIKLPLHDVNKLPLKDNLRFVNKEMHSEQYQHSPVNFEGRVPSFDPIFAVVGSFSFYIVPIGSATIGKSDVLLHIHSVGVYAIANYHFIGVHSSWPGLGWWKKPDGLVIFPSSEMRQVHGYTYITDDDYDRYRKEHGKGGDFIIVSDVRIVELPSPVDELVPIDTKIELPSEFEEQVPHK